MLSRTPLKFLIISLCVALLFAVRLPVRAQEQAAPRVNLYSLQTGGFPVITTGLDILDPAGNVVPGLTAAALTLLEDTQPVHLDTFEEVQVGVEFALALDPGPTFAYRDADAVTRYAKIIQVLNDWAASHTDTLGDDLSLIPTYGTLSAHLANTKAFSDALAAYQPSLPSITPSLDTLAHALDTVSGSKPQAGVKSVILFITSPTAVDSIQTLQNLTERARSQQVRVNVWDVASRDFASIAGATALKDLATQTGGQYELFSGVEPLPGLEMYLGPLRPTYRLSYTSAIRTSGSHTLTVQASLDSETVSSAAVPFDLNLQPPNPILVAPPQQIVRQAPDARTTATTAFLPIHQSIEILVEFPDGRKRPLVRTTLYVDGQKAAENTAEPFDKFTWDLSGIAISAQHSLSVEAVDNLGLSKVSLGVPVTVTVIKPRFGLIPFLTRNSQWVTLAAILLAGSLLGVILAAGRIRRRTPAVNRRSRFDPLTQPVEADLSRRHARLPWQHQAKPTDAYLVRLREDGEPVPAPPIPVTSPEMTFGCDPMLVTRILDDPSVSPLHARLLVKNREYILADENSVAGTWVNYELLTAPRLLQHGDVLQIGRLSYRFMLRTASERPAPKITPTKA